jgi:hypothetical protein
MFVSNLAFKKGPKKRKERGSGQKATSGLRNQPYSTLLGEPLRNKEPVSTLLRIAARFLPFFFFVSI